MGASSTSKARVGRLLRLGVSDGATSSSTDAAAVEELEMELALLREENARLKVERHRRPDSGWIIERMRDLGKTSADARPDEDVSQTLDAAQAIVECLAIRDGLAQACQEIQQAVQGMQSRLVVLAGGIARRAGEIQDGGGAQINDRDGAGDRQPRRQIATAAAEKVDLELAVETEALSGLAGARPE
jgi:hypothetical protein